MPSTSRRISSDGGREREGQSRETRSIDPNNKKTKGESERNWEFCLAIGMKMKGGRNKLPFLCHITEGEYVFPFFPFLSSPLLLTAVVGRRFLVDTDGRRAVTAPRRYGRRTRPRPAAARRRWWPGTEGTPGGCGSCCGGGGT